MGSGERTYLGWGDVGKWKDFCEAAVGELSWILSLRSCMSLALAWLNLSSRILYFFLSSTYLWPSSLFLSDSSS